jgi:hypothetical protein
MARRQYHWFFCMHRGDRRSQRYQKLTTRKRAFGVMPGLFSFCSTPDNKKSLGLLRGLDFKHSMKLVESYFCNLRFCMTGLPLVKNDRSFDT